MCMSCGCNRPNDRHGDDRNIIMQDIKDAAQAAKIPPEEAVSNIQTAFRQAGAEETAGQSSRM